MARRLGARKLPKQKGLDFKLIQESEEPKRNPVSGAGLCLVNSQETVRLVLDLLKRFSRAADLKEIFAIYKEITFLRILQGIIRAYLICKKSFPDSPCFGFAAKGILFSERKIVKSVVVPASFDTNNPYSLCFRKDSKITFRKAK